MMEMAINHRVIFIFWPFQALCPLQDVHITRFTDFLRIYVYNFFFFNFMKILWPVKREKWIQKINKWMKNLIFFYYLKVKVQRWKNKLITEIMWRDFIHFDSVYQVSAFKLRISLKRISNAADWILPQGNLQPVCIMVWVWLVRVCTESLSVSLI